MRDLVEIVLKYLWRFPFVASFINRLAINRMAGATKPRPRPFSLWSPLPKPADPNAPGPITDYTSWPSLNDRLFSGRHLPPADPAYIAKLPPDAPYTGNDIGKITALFKRKEFIPDRSTVLFAFFAQWFTDSFLRIDGNDRRKNTSNPEIDLCQIYGLDEATTHLLRAHKNGKLHSQWIQGEEYLDYLFEAGPDGKWKVKDRYAALPYLNSLEYILAGFPEDRVQKLYATGLERGNSTVGYTAISTLFMREHNRIADMLQKNNPSWDDERLFQTARMINIGLLLKIVIEDYINHIAGHQLFKVDNTFAEKKNWYRTNWIALEFDMLYRWHGLVPDNLVVKNKSYSPRDFRTNNALLEEFGVGTILTSAATQQAGRIGLFNTPEFLLPAEYQTIKMGRDFRLRSYNEYREQFGLPKLTDFSQLTSDKATQTQLKDLYGNIDQLEFIVGLFAEESKHGALSGELLTLMVGSDAFTQALTNPVLSTNIFNEQTLTAYGLNLVKTTSTLKQLVDRNVKNGSQLTVKFDA